MSLLDSEPRDPTLSWREDKSELDTEVSFALKKLLETRTLKPAQLDEDPLSNIQPNDAESHETVAFTELKAKVPAMLERMPLGLPIQQSFSRIFNVFGVDHDRITKLTKRCGLLSNRLFDLEEGQDDELEWRLKDFTENHEPDKLEVEKLMAEMQEKLKGISQAQIDYAEEVVHHAHDTSLALADLNLSLDKSHSMNVKERSAMYFVTGKLTELKGDLKKNLNNDNNLRSTVEQMRQRLKLVIENNAKKLEKRRARRKRRREDRLLKSIKDVNPQLNELSDRLEKLKQYQRNIEERARRQTEMLEKRKVYLEEVESSLNSSKDYSATLHVKSQELASQIRDGLAQSDTDSIGSLTSTGRSMRRTLSTNDTVNRINEVARAKSFAARIKAKSNALKRNVKEEEIGLDDAKLAEDVDELLSITLSNEHPPELHELLTDLRDTSEEHSKVKIKMKELKEEVETKQKSFHEAVIETELLDKQLEKEKEVARAKLIAHAEEKKRLEELKKIQEERTKQLMDEKALTAGDGEDKGSSDSDDSDDGSQEGDGEEVDEENGEEETLHLEATTPAGPPPSNKQDFSSKLLNQKKQETPSQQKSDKTPTAPSIAKSEPPSAKSVGKENISLPKSSATPKSSKKEEKDNQPSSVLLKSMVSKKVKMTVVNSKGEEKEEEVEVIEEVNEIEVGRQVNQEPIVPIRLIGRRASLDEAKVKDQPKHNLVRMPTEEYEALMEYLEQAEKDTRSNRMRIERLGQYCESIRTSLADIAESGLAFDDAVAVLEQAMEQVEALKLDRETCDDATKRIETIEMIESSRNVPGRLNWKDLAFRLPGVEQAMADLRVKGVLEQQIEALAVTKADKQAFTGQIAAMSGSLRSMVTGLRHADHVEMREQLKSIASRLDDSSETFDRFANKVQKETDKMTSTMVSVSQLASAPSIMAKLREEAVKSIEESVSNHSKRVAVHGVAVKKLREDMSKRLHEGLLQEYMVECMDEQFEMKDKQMARITGLVEQLRQENSKLLSRDELLALISSRVMQLLDLGYDVGHVSQSENPDEVLRAALRDKPKGAMKGSKRKNIPQQSVLLKNNVKY